MESRNNSRLSRSIGGFSSRFQLVLMLACGLPVAGWSAPHPHAEGKSPGLTEAQGKDKVPSQENLAHLRLWKTGSASGHVVRVTLAATLGGTMKAGAEVSGFGVSEAGYSIGNYAQVPVGRLSCEVLDSTIAKPGEASLAKLSLALRPGSYGTVLVREGPDKRWRAEYIDDDRADEAPESGQLTVRNLTPGLADVSLKVADVLDAHFTSPSSYLLICGLDLGPAQVSTHGTLPGGQPFEWNTEANFAKCRKATLLIFPDPYGRVRPRLYADGPSPAPIDSSSPEPVQPLQKTIP